MEMETVAHLTFRTENREHIRHAVIGIHRAKIPRTLDVFAHARILQAGFAAKKALAQTELARFNT